MCFYLLCIGQPELRYYDNRRQACGSGPGYIHLGHPGGQLCGEGNGDAFLELVIVSLLHKAVFFPLKAGLEIGEMILAVNKDSLVGSNYDTAANLLKRTEGLVTLVVSNPGKRDQQQGQPAAVTQSAANVVENSKQNAVGKPATLKPSGPPSRPSTPVPGEWPPRLWRRCCFFCHRETCTGTCTLVTWRFFFSVSSGNLLFDCRHRSTPWLPL
jgi:hypothetical protein